MKKATLTLLSWLCALGLYAQDRAPGTNTVYPQGVFGPQIIDITKAPYNAKGDGVTDDTQAFVRAYNKVLREIKEACPPESGRTFCRDLGIRYIFYVPDGTYLVSNTLIYSGPPFTTNVPNIGRFHHIRFIGQSREKTIVKLKDNSPGYGAGSNKPVFSFSKRDFNNTANTTTLRNMTINTGSGNPGAVGVYMAGANNCSSQNLRIVSEDGQGSVGLDFSNGTVIGYHRDIVVEGFDYGVRLTPYHFTNPMIEHITLRDQNKAGVLFIKGTGTIRKLESINQVPAVQCTEEGNHAVILDSKLTGGGSGQPAIDLQKGQVFARNVNVSGYGTAVQKEGNAAVTGNYIEEYVSGKITKWNAQSPDVSMRLPIEDNPEYWSDNLNDWALVDDYPSIQAAFNSGKPIIAFSKRRYSASKPIQVPASVRRVVGMYTDISIPNRAFVVSANSSNPVIFDDIGTRGGTAIVQASPRTIVLNNVSTQANLYESTTSSGKLFINACNGLKYGGPLKNITAFVRFMNTEARNTQFLVDNSDVVVMSYKSEKLYSSFEAINGSRLEILGGLPNQYSNKGDRKNPIIRIRDSEASITLASNGPGRANGGIFDNIIRDTRNGTTKTWTRSDFSLRARPFTVYVPLYTHHDGPYTDYDGGSEDTDGDTVSASGAVSAPTIDGTLDEADWDLSATASKVASGTSDNNLSFGVLWDSAYLYVGAQVTDANLINDSGQPFQDDALEVYLDGGNNGGTTYDADDNQLVIGYGDSTMFSSRPLEGNVRQASAASDGGYSVEVAIPWSSLGLSPAAGTTMGFDVGLTDDDDGGTREGQLVWSGSGVNFRDPSGFGQLVLGGASDSLSAARSGLRDDKVLGDVASTWFRSYPNPADEQLIVEGSDDYRVGVYDLSGRTVMQHEHLKGSTDLDISHLRPGVYVVKMSDGVHPQLQRRLVVE